MFIRRIFLPLFFFVFLFSSVCFALDFDDIRDLVRKGIPDNTIINIVEKQGRGMVLTSSQIIELHRLGASEKLLDALTSLYSPNDKYVEREEVIDAIPSETITATVVPADITISHSAPALGRKEGWITIENRDWETYSLAVNSGHKKMFLSKGDKPGAINIPSGVSVVIAVRKDEYKLYGFSPESVRVKVREGINTIVTLEPFGKINDTGLRAIVNDGRKIRSAILFDTYAPKPVVIIEQPEYYIEEPPPPIIVTPPPVIYQPWGGRDHYRRPEEIYVIPAEPVHPPFFRPAERPPRVIYPRDRRSGWGFSFSD